MTNKEMMGKALRRLADEVESNDSKRIRVEVNTYRYKNEKQENPPIRSKIVFDGKTMG